MIRSLLFLCSLVCGLSLWAQVTFVIETLPLTHPTDDPIYAAGSFNGWDAGDDDYLFTQDATTGSYWLTLGPGSGTIEFKFTRGSWQKVETDAAGNFLPNRTFTYGNGDTLYLSVANWEDLGGGTSGPSTATDNVFVLDDAFYMPQLDRHRRIWVYLPPDYATSQVDYPVLYMHDGQNVFDAGTAFAGEWEVDETLNALHAAGDPGIIVVAIDNGGIHRFDEYSPWLHPTYGGGEGDEYIDFIVETLKPHIDNLYRTRPGREYTGIMGSSLGGLISMYAGLAHQDVFGKVGVFSPSYWVSDAALQQPTSVGKQAVMRFYQLMGTPEGSTHVANMWAMQNELYAAGFTTDEVLTVEKPDGQHSEWFWAREFADAYTWLFADVTTDTDEPTSPVLFQIYPNPVVDALHVSIHLAQATETTLILTDSTGRFAQTLFWQELSPGEHTFRWSLALYNLPAGTYYCTLSLAGQTQLLEFVLTE